MMSAVSATKRTMFYIQNYLTLYASTTLLVITVRVRGTLSTRIHQGMHHSGKCTILKSDIPGVVFRGTHPKSKP